MASDGAAGAMAAQAAVQRLVEAVKEGNLSQLKAASKALGGGPEGVKGVRDSYGRGMLHYAAQFGHAKVIQHLVDTCNMDVNEQDSAGEPPLALAAATGKEAAVKLLLSLGADPSLRKDPAATAPVHRAATASENGGNAPGVLSLLLEDSRVAVDTPSSTGTPLCWAAGAGNIGAVRLLLSKGADPNDAGCGSEPMPALSLAVASSSSACVEALIAAGAKVGTTGRGGATPLHVAAAMSNPDSAAPCGNVDALLKAGADPNVCDRSGLTPLEVAIAAGNQAVAALLFPLTKPKDGVEPWDMEHLTKHVQEAVKTMGQAEGSQGRDVKILIPEAPQPDKEQAAAWKRKGDVAFVGKEYDTAADAYSQSLLHDTQNAVVWANRAAAFLKLEQARDALMDAQRSRTLDPKYDKAWYREGAAYEMLLDWENAAGAYYEGCNLQQGSANADFEAAFKRAIKRGQEEYQAKQQAGKA